MAQGRSWHIQQGIEIKQHKEEEEAVQQTRREEMQSVSRIYGRSILTGD